MKHAALLSADPLVTISLTAAQPMPDPLDSVRTHLAAVAAGDQFGIVCSYHGKAASHWIGGPVHGSYAGVRQIASMWERFLAARPVDVGVSDLRASVHPGETTVTGELTLHGAILERIHYFARVRRGLLMDEVWRFEGCRMA